MNKNKKVVKLYLMIMVLYGYAMFYGAISDRLAGSLGVWVGFLLTAGISALILAFILLKEKSK